jgi:hypothetical protein
VGSFLREVNVGISYVPTPLAIITWNTTIDDGVHSWACPAVNPRSAGFVCPVSLYGAKAFPPTRAERGQEPTVRRRSHAAGSGLNYRHSRRRIRHRNPQPVARTQALFKRPRRLRRLGDWTFPTPNHVSTATDADDDDDGSISASDMAHESRDDEDNTFQIDQMTEECPEWIDDTDEHSCSPQTIPPRNARKRKSHAVIKRRATTSESSDEDEQSYVISKIFTQNAHGLR